MLQHIEWFMELTELGNAGWFPKPHLVQTFSYSMNLKKETEIRAKAPDWIIYLRS